MRTIAFDGRMGAAGDMILGALVAAGGDPDALAPVEDALPVRYEFESVDRTGIESVRARVRHAEADAARDDADAARDDTDQATDRDDDHDHGDSHGRGHSHDHGDDGDHDHPHDHSHEDDQSHDHDHDHPHDGHGAEGHGPQRTYAEVVEVVEGMALPASVRADALAVFEILGEAESSVHGTDLDDTHFHEVGADDAIADVVGACLLFDDLDADRVVTTPLATGDGEVEFSHGVYPVPTPAVMEVAERADWSLRGGPVEAELLTPTGAAILAHVADGVERLPSLRVEESGYGAGGWTFPDRPNVLRAVVGETERSGLVRDDVTVLETNLDDAAPEVLGGLQETLAEAGARDVSVVPTTMKKSRPGHIVKVICKPEDADRVARRLAEETGTLGVREGGATHRWIAQRRFETAAVDLADGESYDVPVKVASDADGAVYDVSAEYDDAAAAAREAGVPVRDVLRRAEAIVRERLAVEANGDE
ncbi:nickel pincer cofactor biosynthesis protein LarC [Halobaculum sp. CBA1158]|uniref:nickel pincer cofactor biosynthesis protein LarC n=1 Tax=Halobaculum sp. CBA1158 TaxID=2904243 RepID=UPI001F311107|nr:nickel pincer cofactor biosynthesis protein LarC [Halobaculum sp. CBA1158]UIO99441.1 nickel pincer cofactor biosynthesis protein LarC [Halobaculum sp. CBA1158]